MNWSDADQALLLEVFENDNPESVEGLAPWDYNMEDKDVDKVIQSYHVPNRKGTPRISCYFCNTRRNHLNGIIVRMTDGQKVLAGSHCLTKKLHLNLKDEHEKFKKTKERKFYLHYLDHMCIILHENSNDFISCAQIIFDQIRISREQIMPDSAFGNLIRKESGNGRFLKNRKVLDQEEMRSRRKKWESMKESERAEIIKNGNQHWYKSDMVWKEEIIETKFDGKFIFKENNQISFEKLRNFVYLLHQCVEDFSNAGREGKDCSIERIKQFKSIADDIVRIIEDIELYIDALAKFFEASIDEYISWINKNQTLTKRPEKNDYISKIKSASMPTFDETSLSTIRAFRGAISRASRV